jgi:hypothetical protein
MHFNERFLFAVAICLSVVYGNRATAEDAKWITIKGQIVWQGPVPIQKKIVPNVNANICAKDPVPLEEDYVINPKNQGVKNVFIWIRPTGAAKDDAFPKELIHPKLKKPEKDTVEIDQPCCRFIPHVLAAREGQKMVIKNGAPIAHNANWNSDSNGVFNQLIAAGGKHVLPNALVAEPGEIRVSCNLHGWMKAHIRVFDHPYYAVTDADGKFEIKLVPSGKFNVFVHHPDNGWLNGVAGRNGKTMVIKGDDLDLGVVKMKENKRSP